MTQSNQTVKGLVIYAAILPLAIFLGYLLASPLRQTNMIFIGVVLLVLVTPLILRWHHPLLLLSWNMTAVLPFMGRPQLWLAMAFVSLTISLMQYALTRKIQFVKTKSILYPLLFIGVVVLVTAQLTGGIGLNVMGSSNIGGRKYVIMLAAILGYIAITAHPIPKSHVHLYLGLFLLGALSNAVGNALPYVPSALYPLFSIFPVESQGIQAVVGESSVVGTQSVTRFFGLSVALMALAYFFVARHGLNELLNARKPGFWLFLLGLGASTLGGFRSFLILSLMTITFVFFFEGLHRSRKMPAFVIAFLLSAVVVAGFSDRLPRSVQRSLSFLPVRVDPMVKLDAKGSSEWRLEMWEKLLPLVTKHLLLGKGVSISAAEFEMVNNLSHQGRGTTAETAIMAGDYHSGPLSVMIPFGIWGLMGWIWFAVAGMRALYFNYRYSAPELKTVNTFLFAYFLSKMVLFHTVFGAFETELMVFTGLLGFSVSLNGGIRKPASERSTAKVLSGPLSRPRLMPGFSHLNMR